MLAGRKRALATVDLSAIRHNVSRLAEPLPPGCAYCAVVKANGYGHGAAAVAREAVAAGARWLGVATVDEAEELRGHGLTQPLLIFGPLTGAELERAVHAHADVVVWTQSFLVEALRHGARVHLKLDSGMGRLGATEATVERLAELADEAGRLVGLMSHFATADRRDEFFAFQLDRFLALATKLKRRYPGLIAHTANSAATLWEPRAWNDMVRCGIAMYGLAPANDSPDADGLLPALSLSSYVAAVREVVPGQSVGYGRTFVAERPTRVGVVPIGYADGVARALSNRGEVLVNGRRCRIRGTISMDQLTVELPSGVGRAGDTVTFIGVSGSERILAEDVARLLGTINYEVVCDIGPRVERRYIGEPSASSD